MVNEKNAPNTQCAGSKLPALLSHEISRLPVLPALAPRPPRTRTAAMSAPPARPCAATSDQRLHSARVAARNPDILQMPNYRALTHTCVGRVVTSLGHPAPEGPPRAPLPRGAGFVDPASLRLEHAHPAGHGCVSVRSARTVRLALRVASWTPDSGQPTAPQTPTRGRASRPARAPRCPSPGADTWRLLGSP